MEATGTGFPILTTGGRFKSPLVLTAKASTTEGILSGLTATTDADALLALRAESLTLGETAPRAMASKVEVPTIRSKPIPNKPQAGAGGGGTSVEVSAGSGHSSQLINALSVEENASLILRLCPHNPRLPMHVDSELFTFATSFTSKGAKRNGPQFWKLWNEKYSGTLSPANLNEIKSNLSPLVDETWLRTFPEHQSFLGQVLEHHHLDHGRMAYPLPKPLHRLGLNSKIWHS